MKHIKKFNENFHLNENKTALYESEKNYSFVKIEPANKVDPDFEATAIRIANSIRKDPKLETLKELAMGYVKYDGGLPGEHPENDKYYTELEKNFPEVKEISSQYIKGGMKIPFYGRIKSSFIDLLTGHKQTNKTMDIYQYIAKKVKDPGYKFG